MKHEWRRHEKALYGAGKTPGLVDVPAQKFIVISGRGDPNGEDFSARISALYPLAYALRSVFKARDEDYAVYPLEGLWRGSLRGGQSRIGVRAYDTPAGRCHGGRILRSA